MSPIVSLVVLLIVLPACGGTGPAPSTSAAAVERGRYMAAILGCGDCHTPLVMGPRGPEPDMTHQLAGHPESLVMPPPPATGDSPWVWHGAGTNTAFAGPWGISYAINLTPDEVTGIGSWTEEMFVNAIRTGRHWGQSRPILPPMPWPAYAHLTDADLKAVYAWLRTVPAIKNQVPDAVVAPPPAGP